MNKQLHPALVSFLRHNADENGVITLHNEHAHSDDYIYDSIEEIADLIDTADDPTRIARMVYYGNVQSWNGGYFCLNGYGNICSFYSLTDELSPVDFAVLAERIIENEQFDEVGFDTSLYLSDDE